MAYADEGTIRVCNRTALGAGNGHDLPVQEIAARGGDKDAAGRINYVAGMFLEFADSYVATSAQLGATAGHRLNDFVGRVELSLPGWPGNTVFRASGRSIRMRSIKIMKKLPVADPAAVADADATFTDCRRVLYIPFRRYISGYKPNDFMIPCSLFERGSLLLDLVLNPLTGITLTDTDVIVRAVIKKATPRQPTFWKFVENTPTQGPAFDIPSSPEAFHAIWGFLTGQRAADQTENQFGPAVTTRLMCGGDLVLDGRVTIQELNEGHNVDLYDAAIAEAPATPILLPLMNYGSGVKSSQVQGSGHGFPRFEGGGALTAAAGNGTAATDNILKVCSEEILSAPIGSHDQVSHLRAQGATGPVQLKLDVADKSPLKSAAVSVRIPKKIKSWLAARRRTV